MPGWRARVECTSDRTSYMETDCRYEVRIEDVDTGKVVMTLHYSYWENANHSTGRMPLRAEIVGESVRVEFASGDPEIVRIEAKS